MLMSRPPPVPWAMGWLSQYLEVVLNHIRGMMTFSRLPGDRSTNIWHSGWRKVELWVQVLYQFVLAMGSDGSVGCFPSLAEGTHPK